VAKRQFLIFLCFLFGTSLSYSSTIIDLESLPTLPLESLLLRIKSMLDTSIDECSEVDSASSPRIVVKKPVEMDVAELQAISRTIAETEALYKNCKYGNMKALSILELRARESIYACVLMMKYYANLEKEKGIENFTSSEFGLCLSNFMHFLKEKITASFKFEVIEDQFLNLALALFHQMRGDHKLAEQFANAVAKRGCLEGYNIVGNLYKNTNTNKAILAYLKSAEHDNPKGIYKLARLCDKMKLELHLDQNFIKDLYGHAANRGSFKAYFALGRWYEKRRHKGESIDCISHLIELDPYLYVHMEQKEGLGHTAFNVAGKLLKREPLLLLLLLESIYGHNPLKRKKIAHLLAVGYGLGRYGFTHSREDACRWLNISATEHQNLEDGYLLCCISAADLQRKESNSKAVALSRSLLESPVFLEKYGTVPQILLTQLLVTEAENQDNPRYLEEASYWLLRALNDFEKDSLRRKKIVWQIPKTNIRGRFSEVENAHLVAIEDASSFLERQQAYYSLAFHNLSGGQKPISLANAQRYFVRAGNLLPSSTYFYVTVINYYLSMRRLMHPLEDYTERGVYQQHEVIRITNAMKTSRIIFGLLDRQKDLEESERDLLKKKVRELSFTNLKESALSLAFWFRNGMFGLSRSIEHEIYWLKYAASKGEEAAQKFLNLRYPHVPPLVEAEELVLDYSRTHSGDRPNFVFVGGGISGSMAAILFAKTREDRKVPIGKITIVDQSSYLGTGASGLVSRQHKGGEYPKEEDHLTGKQCLYSSAIWKQSYGTERMLTEKKKNEFLLAKRSQEIESGDASLSKEELLAHHAFLDAHYRRYLAEFEKLGLNGEKQLFGPSPLFEELGEDYFEDLGLSPHFVAGVSTGERGFNPIAIGAILEHLLRKYNVDVITGYEVIDIKALRRGGFQIEGRGQRPIYTQYLVNAAWHNNSKLRAFLKNSLPSTALTLPRFSVATASKRVFLRCLALADIRECTLPEDRSFFGLLGEEGGMVSCFNDWVASIFIPKDGLSYHGEYNLDESAVNMLPRTARARLAQLESNKMSIAASILADAQTKYPFLRNAKPRGISIQTTVSDNLDQIYKRNHSNAKWIEGVEGCLEICATKATFGPFQALQALARFAVDRPGGLENRFNAEEMRFLDSLIHPDMFKDDTVESVVLPDSFKIIFDDTFMTDAEFLSAMRRYAFVRGFDFAIFEKTREIANVGANPIEQLRLISEEKGMKSLDLEYHTLNEEMAKVLFPLLGRSEGLRNIKLGPLDEEINDDEEDGFGADTLAGLLGNDHLRNLTLKDWNLTFKSRYRPLAVLLPKLQEIHLKGVTLTLNGVQTLFGNTSDSFSFLKRLTVVDSNPKKSVLKRLMIGMQKCVALEFLDLSGNGIGKESSDEMSSDLGNLVRESLVRLKILFLHNNKLFEGINLNPFETFSLPVDIEANPFLLAVTGHPALETVSVMNNGPASALVQDRLDSYFLKKELN
jgi:TPR repeat protein